MFFSTPGIQTELRRCRSPSHRHETNDFCPSGQQAETGAGGGCLGGEPRDSLGSECCRPCRQQPPRREAFTPWLMASIAPETRWVKGTAWCCYSCFRLALWTRKGEMTGVKEREREREVSPVSDQEHPSQTPALSCQGWVAPSSSALWKPTQASSQPSCSNLPRLTATPPQDLDQIRLAPRTVGPS